MDGAIQTPSLRTLLQKSSKAQHLQRSMVCHFALFCAGPVVEQPLELLKLSSFFCPARVQVHSWTNAGKHSLSSGALAELVG